MKKVFGVLFVLCLSVATVQAQGLQDGSGESGSWWIQGGVGGGIITNQVDSSSPEKLSGIGFNYDGLLGRHFNRDFSLGVEFGYRTFGLTNVPSNEGLSLAYNPLELVVRYEAGGKGLRPYLSLGGGLAFVSISKDSQASPPAFTFYQETDFVLSPSLGADFDLGNQASFFLQAGMDLVFLSDSFSGFASNLGSPVLTIPVEVGLHFSAN